MRVLVTGGAGFIGSNLCRRLVDEGEDVVVLDDLSTGYERNLQGIDVEFIRGSILDTDLLGKAIRGAGSVVHLAALGSVPRSVADPIASHEANASGTLNVLLAAREAAAYVTIASSSSVYGSVPDLPRTEDLATRPMSPYAASKLAAESYTLAFGRAYDMATLPFRFFNVYGPGQAAGHAYAAVIPVFIDAALRGLPLPVHGDGLQSRDFTFVDTVTWVLARAAIDQVTSEVPINLALGANVTLMDAIEGLEQIVGRDLKIQFEPPRIGDVRASQSDCSRLKTLFSDIPEVTLDEGLRRTVEWFISSTEDGSRR